MVSIIKTFNINVPHKDSLCCAICKIVNSENDPLIYSKFCSNRIKCRQFLQATPQAMIAPVTNQKILRADGSMYVIVTKEFFKSCTFQDNCNVLNIQVLDLLNSIPTHIYKACLLYTMEYKLAPQWNKVGSYLVEGQDFLSSIGSVNAITLNIKEIHDNSAQLHVEAVNLKIPFLRLNTTRPSQYDLQPLVRVLPSMKMAKVLRISKIIKEKHIIKNYEDLCSYWKNMHGYILPDYEEGLLFYNIEFYYFKSSVFIYPETCLTSGPLEILPPEMDPMVRIYKFVGDLKRTVTKLCGQQVDIYPESTYQAAVTYTPALSKFGKFSTCDTGYGTQSRRISSVTPLLRIPDTCDIPSKRSRLLLSRINNSITCGTEIDDFDFEINSKCSTSKFKPVKTSILALVCDNADNAVATKSVVQKDESKSHYFKQEEQESESKPSVELKDEEEKPDKLHLKEKLLRNF